MGALEQLLVVQDHDTHLAQLQHRRDHLPARAQLTENRTADTAAVRDLATAVARRDEAAGRQAALEAEVETATTRIAGIEGRLYGGTVTASRDLQAMSAEADALKARRSALEDDELAVMEELEPLVAEVESIEARRVALAEEAARLVDEIAAGEAEIDAELMVERAARAELVAAVPAELVSSYESLRSQLGGTGAARLVGTSCTGCHLTLPSSEVDRIKHLPPDTLVNCEQCGRILVH